MSRSVYLKMCYGRTSWIHLHSSWCFFPLGVQLPLVTSQVLLGYIPSGNKQKCIVVWEHIPDYKTVSNMGALQLMNE